MSEKSVQKKQMILDKAKEVFAVKGFATVTMKDIVEACDISRGGLYLYFDNPRDIFLAVLEREYSDEGSFGGSINADATPADILGIFFREQKREIINKKGSLLRACYEFFFSYVGDRKKNFLRQQFEGGILVLEKLLEKGVETGEFSCDDPKATARNIMYLLEGLRISSRIYGVTEKSVDEEILYIMQNIVAN